MNGGGSPSLPPCHNEPSLRTFGLIDSVIILLIAVGSVFTLPALRSLSPGNVVIYRENRRIATYPLTVDRTVSINGHNGPVEIVIKDRTVAITRSSCPHGLCVKSGAIGTPHRQIVCAPNRILVTITSSTNNTLDAIAR